MLRCVICLTLGMLLAKVAHAGEEAALRIATFDVDATPPVGSPVAYARVRSVVDPLHAKGVVLLPGGQQPIVICVLDWIGIANGSHDWWRQGLAAAAGTTPERVAVHTVHQHDGPQCDVSAMALFAQPSQADPHFDMAFVQRVKGAVEQAIRDGLTIAWHGDARRCGQGEGRAGGVQSSSAGSRRQGGQGAIQQLSRSGSDRRSGRLDRSVSPPGQFLARRAAAGVPGLLRHAPDELLREGRRVGRLCGIGRRSARKSRRA